MFREIDGMSHLPRRANSRNVSRWLSRCCLTADVRFRQAPSQLNRRVNPMIGFSKRREIRDERTESFGGENGFQVCPVEPIGLLQWPGERPWSRTEKLRADSLVVGVVQNLASHRDKPRAVCVGQLYPRRSRQTFVEVAVRLNSLETARRLSQCYSRCEFAKRGKRITSAKTFAS